MSDKFPISSGVSIPTAVRAGRKSKYPFDQLAAPEDGQYSSFAAEGKIQAIKGATYLQNKRMKDLGDERRYRAFAVDPNSDPDGASVRVFRVN